MHKKRLQINSNTPFYVDRRINERKILLSSPHLKLKFKDFPNLHQTAEPSKNSRQSPSLGEVNLSWQSSNTQRIKSKLQQQLMERKKAIDCQKSEKQKRVKEMREFQIQNLRAAICEVLRQKKEIYNRYKHVRDEFCHRGQPVGDEKQLINHISNYIIEKLIKFINPVFNKQDKLNYNKQNKLKLQRQTENQRNEDMLEIIRELKNKEYCIQSEISQQIQELRLHVNQEEPSKQTKIINHNNYQLQPFNSTNQQPPIKNNHFKSPYNQQNRRNSKRNISENQILNHPSMNNTNLNYFSHQNSHNNSIQNKPKIPSFQRKNISSNKGFNKKQLHLKKTNEQSNRMEHSKQYEEYKINIRQINNTQKITKNKNKLTKREQKSSKKLQRKQKPNNYPNKIGKNKSKNAKKQYKEEKHEPLLLSKRKKNIPRFHNSIIKHKGKYLYNDLTKTNIYPEKIRSFRNIQMRTPRLRKNFKEQYILSHGSQQSLSEVQSLFHSEQSQEKIKNLDLYRKVVNAFSDKNKKDALTKYEEARLLYSIQRNKDKNENNFELKLKLEERKPRKSRSGFRVSASLNRRASTDSSIFGFDIIKDINLKMNLIKRLDKISKMDFNLSETKQKIKNILQQFKFTEKGKELYNFLLFIQEDIKKKIMKQQQLIKNNEEEFLNDEAEIENIVHQLKPNNQKQLYFDWQLLEENEERYKSKSWIVAQKPFQQKMNKKVIDLFSWPQQKKSINLKELQQVSLQQIQQLYVHP